jgi:hypothetical protein
MTRPCIIVAGLGRCGSSLTMQMLHAAAVRCVGDHPDYEDRRASDVGFDPDWLGRLEDCAVKVLDAHRLNIHNLPNHVVVWLDRSPDEQAKSMLKLVSAAFRNVGAGRAERRAMAASIKRDGPRALSNLGSRCQRVLRLRFEHLIDAPRESAAVLAAFVDRCGYPVDAAAMAAVVRPRRSACLDGFLEAELVAP